MTQQKHGSPQTDRAESDTIQAKLQSLPRLEREYCVYLVNLENRSKFEIKNRIRFFGFKVRCNREHRNLTQEQLAFKVGYSQPSICLVENGEIDDINPNMFYELCSYLRLNTKEWINFFSFKLSESSEEIPKDPQTREEIFGAEIQRRRLRMELNRIQVADLLGCNPVTLKLLESGKLANIKTIFLMRLAKILNCDIHSWILFLSRASDILDTGIPDGNTYLCPKPTQVWINENIDQHSSQVADYLGNDFFHKT